MLQGGKTAKLRPSRRFKDTWVVVSLHTTSQELHLSYPGVDGQAN